MVVLLCHVAIIPIDPSWFLMYIVLPLTTIRYTISTATLDLVAAQEFCHHCQPTDMFHIHQHSLILHVYLLLVASTGISQISSKKPEQIPEPGILHQDIFKNISCQFKGLCICADGATFRNIQAGPLISFCAPTALQG